MHIYDYIDPYKLQECIVEGFVEKRECPFAALDLYVHTRKAVLEQFWDEVTTRCRGLIVNRDTDQIVARPFEKFFNVDTPWRPETCVSNLPLTKPVISEKLDGSLGILYRFGNQVAIATKGSFISDQAKWATEWYNRWHPDAEWPADHTPIFEIIAESVQHHVVHYNGHERLVLIALINNETGEELNQTDLHFWGQKNHIEVAQNYDRKGLGDVLNEDRKNAEGYVLSWPRPGQPPLKVKVKHPSFLDLQKVVHAATPKAILEALINGNVDLLNTWSSQSNEQLGQWIQEWVSKFQGKYLSIFLKCKLTTNAGISKCEDRKSFALYIKGEAIKTDNVYPSVCFAMLDEKDHRPAIWKIVGATFEKELGRPFALLEE